MKIVSFPTLIFRLVSAIFHGTEAFCCWSEIECVWCFSAARGALQSGDLFLLKAATQGCFMRFCSEKPLSTYMLETGMMLATFANVAHLRYISLLSWIKTLQVVGEVKPPWQRSAFMTCMTSRYTNYISIKGIIASQSDYTLKRRNMWKRPYLGMQLWM